MKNEKIKRFNCSMELEDGVLLSHYIQWSRTLNLFIFEKPMFIFRTWLGKNLAIVKIWQRAVRNGVPMGGTKPDLAQEMTLSIFSSHH